MRRIIENPRRRNRGGRVLFGLVTLDPAGGSRWVLSDRAGMHALPPASTALAPLSKEQTRSYCWIGSSWVIPCAGGMLGVAVEQRILEMPNGACQYWTCYGP